MCGGSGVHGDTLVDSGVHGGAVAMDVAIEADWQEDELISDVTDVTDVKRFLIFLMPPPLL